MALWLDKLSFMLLFAFALTVSCQYPHQQPKEIQPCTLKLAPVQSIEYKYKIKTLLPPQTVWWKRGTHRQYDPNVPDVMVIPES